MGQQRQPSYLQEGVSVPWSTGLQARILPGYYVAWAAALLCLVLAVVRGWLTGESKVHGSS